MSKEIIIDAAEKLFSNKGYYQTSMQDIADEAQVAKGTLYYHFKSKEELFIKLLESGTDILIHQFRKSFDSHKPLDQQLNTFVTIVVDIFFIKYKNFIDILFNEVSKGMDQEIHNKVAQVREEYIKIFVDILEEGYGYNCVKKMNFRIASIGIIHMLQGMSYDIGEESNVTREQVIDHLLMFIKSGIMK